MSALPPAEQRFRQPKPKPGDTQGNEEEPEPYPTECLEDYAKITRELILHESVRMNERATWLLQSQGLLFTALAFAWKDAPELVPLLAFVGICSAASIGLTLHWALKATETMQKEWKRMAPNYPGPPIIGLRRKEAWPYRNDEDNTWYKRWLHPVYSLPLTFIIGWIWVL